jgi:hypothetical protein
MYGSEWGETRNYQPLPRARRRYKPAGRLARVAVWLLMLAIAANVAIAIIGFVNVGLLTSAMNNPSDAGDLIERRDSLMTTSVIIYWASLVPAGIAFMVWMSCTYANTEALAPEYPRYWLGWAWLGWILPIMNLFRPKQVVNDIWRATAHHVPGWITGWWALWLGIGIVSRVVSRVEVDTLAQFRWFDGVDAALSLALAATGVLAIRFVRRTTEIQEEDAARPRDEEPPRREQRIAREGEKPEGFTITPGWAPSESK